MVVAGRATAQQGDSRLERLDAATRPTVAALVDSARTAMLPTEPLVQRALEGATKRASGDAIVAAVRRLAADLGHAHDARSEEHTSELQSRFDLVCRLLLEKKKIIKWLLEPV